METPFTFWDTMAKRYPRFNDESMSKDVNRILSWCQEHNLTFNEKRVLDIGAGTGAIAIPLAQLGAHITAMDISQGMLDALNEDAKTHHLASHITTHQSDWDSFVIEEPFDIVIASMTPAISDLEKIDKMLNASNGFGVYVGWGKYRNNKLVTALIEAHHFKEDECTSAGCMNAQSFINILSDKDIRFETHFFDTSWTDTYSVEDAKEYAYDQLKRKELVPNEEIVERVLKEHMIKEKVHVTTEAEKGIVLWRR